MKILGISAGLSDSSASSRLAVEIGEAAARELSAEVDVVALRPYARDIADAIVMGYANAHLEELFAQVSEADALVAVAPVYNVMPSGLFVSLFNVLPEDTLSGKPVALGATGGTPRHGLVIEQAMRPMFVYLHAMVPSTAVYAATEDWGAPGVGFDDAAGKALAGRIAREGRELAGLIRLARSEASGAGGADLPTVPSAGSAEGANLEPTNGPPGSTPVAGTLAAASTGSSVVASARRDVAEAKELFDNFVPFDQLLK